MFATYPEMILNITQINTENEKACIQHCTGIKPIYKVFVFPPLFEKIPSGKYSEYINPYLFVGERVYLLLVINYY